MKLSYSIIYFLILFSSNLFPQNGWNPQTNPLGTGENAMLGKIQFVSLSEGWIATGGGKMLHTTNGGTDWLLEDPFANDTLSGYSDPAMNMSWTDQDHGWILYTKWENAGAVVIKTTNGGTSWDKIELSNDPGDAGIQLQFTDANNGRVLIFNTSSFTPKFLKTTDGGNNWSPFIGAGIFYFVDVNNGWAYTGSGQGGIQPPYKIMHTTNSGTDWNEQFSDAVSGVYNAIHFTDLNNGWIVGNEGKVLRTTNGGSNWNYVTNTGINPNSSCKTVFFSDANHGWIPSKDNSGFPYIQHTTNGGASWITEGTPLGSQGNNAIFNIYFLDSQNGWLTADYGRIAHTTNGGITAVENENMNPGEFVLKQNYPNPFNPSTTIGYNVAEHGRAKITVTNLMGEEVAVLVDNEKEPGYYTVEFNATDLTSGVYFYTFQSGAFTKTNKMILMK